MKLRFEPIDLLHERFNKPKLIFQWRKVIKRRKNELMKGPVYEGMNSFNTDYTKKVRTEEEIEIMELNKFKPT